MSLWKSRLLQAFLTAAFFTVLQYVFIHHYITMTELNSQHSESAAAVHQANEMAAELIEAEKVINELKSANALDEQAPPDSEDALNPRVNEVCYRDPNAPGERIGRPFVIEQRYRKVVDDYIASKPLRRKRKTTIVPQAVTAFSSNHYHEHTQIIPSFFEHFPDQKVMVYDIGLSQQQVNYFQKNTTHYIYRKYDFLKYPAHAHTLMNMVFKITIWIECLMSFKACMWFDTSIWFTKSADVAIQKYALGKDTDFIYYIHPAGHNIAWATHPEMFGFFPSNVSVFNESPVHRKMSMAGAVILYDTYPCRHGILKWALLCALEEQCISPVSELWPKRERRGELYYDNHYCNGEQPQQKPYNCHRYDQSLLSILVNNFYKYDILRFHMEPKDWMAEAKRLGDRNLVLEPKKKKYMRVT